MKISGDETRRASPPDSPLKEGSNATATTTLGQLVGVHTGGLLLNSAVWWANHDRGVLHGLIKVFGLIQVGGDFDAVAVQVAHRGCE